MKTITSLFFLFFGVIVHGQVGIGTTTPNSTLDIRGSFATKYRTVTASTTAATIVLPSGKNKEMDLKVQPIQQLTPVTGNATTTDKSEKNYSELIAILTNSVKEQCMRPGYPQKRAG